MEVTMSMSSKRRKALAVIDKLRLIFSIALLATVVVGAFGAPDDIKLAAAGIGVVTGVVLKCTTIL